MELFKINPQLFLSTFVLIFLAELPDKTALATVMLATGRHPIAVFLGAALAFATQSLVGVCFGSMFSLLPAHIVKMAAGISFLVFGILMLWKKETEENKLGASESNNGSFYKVAWKSFMVIFLAEWGDLTQLATAALAAKNKEPFTIFISSTLALWGVSALAVFVGHRLKKVIRPHLIQRIAGITFVIVGIVFLIS